MFSCFQHSVFISVCEQNLKGLETANIDLEESGWSWYLLHFSSFSCPNHCHSSSLLPYGFMDDGLPINKGSLTTFKGFKSKLPNVELSNEKRMNLNDRNITYLNRTSNQIQYFTVLYVANYLVNNMTWSFKECESIAFMFTTCIEFNEG